MVSVFMCRLFSRNCTVFEKKIIKLKVFSLKPTFLLQRQTFRQIQTRDRLKLERIHKKREDAIARSREALKKLRKKNLEGLSAEKLPNDVEIGKWLAKASSIGRLMYIYKSNKRIETLSLSNEVKTLRCLAQLYDKNSKERLGFSSNSVLNSLDDIIMSITDSRKMLSPKEVVDVVVSLSLLRITGQQKYHPFIREIQAHGMKEFTSENIGMLCFAFGFAKNKNSLELMEEIETELLCRPLLSFSNSALSEIAWAFMELDIPADKLLDEVCAEILSRDLSLFESRDIALIALAFTRVESLAQCAGQALHDSLYKTIETLKFPTRDLMALTVALLRSDVITKKMFRKLDTILVSRRDFEQNVSKELLEEFLFLLKRSTFHLSETGKIIENVLYPNSLNSVFDGLFRIKMSWKAKVFKQSWFKVY